MDKLVSVIVPIYNTEKELTRCIDSIVNQTYTNLEIILVNDGSTDNSKTICDNYEKIDNRIIVFHQKNSGVSSARNKGLELSSGDKIVFIDSDDYIELNYIENLMDYSNYDLVVSGYKFISNKVREYKPVSNTYTDEIIRIIVKKEYQLFIGVPCLKLYDSNIIKKNNIKFDITMNYGEDTCFVYNYIKYIKNLKFDSKAYYNNCIREGSLSRKIINDPWDNMYKVFKTGIELYDDKKIYQKEITEIFLRAFKITCNQLLNSKTNKKDFIKNIKEIKNIEEYSYITNKDLSKYSKIIIDLLNKNCFGMLYMILKLKHIVRGY